MRLTLELSKSNMNSKAVIALYELKYEEIEYGELVRPWQRK